MPRSRTLKPEFFTDADLCELPPLHRLLYAGLWGQADRRGVFLDKPRELKTKLLPYDSCDVDAMLSDLQQRGFVRRYVARGYRCGYLPKLPKHQHFHKDEKQSDLPGPEASEVPPVATPRPAEFQSTPAPPQPGADAVAAPPEPGANTPVICNLVTGSGLLVSGAGTAAPTPHTVEPVSAPPPAVEPTTVSLEPTLAESILSAFSEAFECAKGEPYALGLSQNDGQALRRLVATGVAVEEVKRRLSKAFSDDWFRDHADLALFVKQWNRHAGTADPPAQERPPCEVCKSTGDTAAFDGRRLCYPCAAAAVEHQEIPF